MENFLEEKKLFAYMMHIWIDGSIFFFCFLTLKTRFEEMKKRIY